MMPLKTLDEKLCKAEKKVRGRRSECLVDEARVWSAWVVRIVEFMIVVAELVVCWDAC